MIFNKVTLHNFGIYEGEHCFDFQLEPSHQNIILVNAKNGSGKTTLLTGIKVGLYGPLLMGYRHINQRYQSFIFDKMNTSAWIRGETEASIVLDFFMGNHGTNEQIVLERKWDFNKNNTIERVTVQKNDKVLSPKEILEFESFIRKFWPPTLFEFFLFDGEQIHHQLEEGVLLGSLKDAFRSLFNLDLVASLQHDLHSYLGQDKIFKKLDKEQQNYFQLVEKYNDLQTQLSDQEFNIKSLGTQIEDYHNQTKQLETEFKVNGGLAAEEREQARLQLTKIEHMKREESEWLKSFVSELLPFYLVRGLLFDAKEQVILESRHRALEVFAETGLEKLNNTYWKLIHDGQISIKKDGLHDYAAALWEELVTQLTAVNEPVNIIHDLNETEKQHMFSMVKEVKDFDPNRVSKALNKISKYNNKAYKLNKIIEMNNENEDLNRLLQQISINNQEIIKLSSFKEQLIIQNAETKAVFLKVHDELVKAEKIIHQSEKNENIFVMVNRLDKVLSLFQDKVAEHKTESIKLNFLSCFRLINHKDNFIKDVNFDLQNDNFKIQLIDEKGANISYNQLSAGEKQLFLLSLTWALLKASNREVPLFFDTLLGRLDQQHRENIINRFLPNISQQVVVLSTDTEIDNHYYSLIEPHIAFEYDLIVNQQTGKVGSVKKSPSERKQAHAV